MCLNASLLQAIQPYLLRPLLHIMLFAMKHGQQLFSTQLLHHLLESDVRDVRFIVFFSSRLL